MNLFQTVVGALVCGLLLHGRAAECAPLPDAAASGKAVLRGTVLDADTGKPTACTVTITDANGKVVTETPSFESGFRSSGTFSKSLPPGRTRLRVTRGFETKAVDREVELRDGEETPITVTLKRTVDLRRMGWYAGDSHAHMLHGERTVPVDFDFVALTTQAEDLQYLSLAQAWSLENPTPERLERELKSRSKPDCVLTWNLEAPKNYYKGDAGRCLGHCWNVGMRGRTREGLDVIQLLMNASAWDYESTKPTFANFESHSLIHAQGGAVFYTHPARWWMGSWGGHGGYPKVEQMRVSNMAVELPLDTLIGPTFDGVDVLTGAGEHEANAKAFQLWCMLLNQGYRLSATGCSDACFDRPGGAVPGSARLYTFIPGKFSLAKAARAAAAGRTFATTGPLLITAIDDEPPGTAFVSGPKERALVIQAWASGKDSRGLQRLEVFRNGREFKQFSFPGALETVQTNLVLREMETAWYCVRAFGGNERTQKAVSGAFYFADKNYRPPAPVRARVQATIVDDRSGEKLSATLTEVTFHGTVPRDGKTHRLPSGEERFSVPGTVRLRAEAKGYAPFTLSPCLDSPNIVKTVTELSDGDLLDWGTYERLREQLSNIELVFRLRRTR